MPFDGKRLRQDSHPNERPVAPCPPKDKTDDEDFICAECEAVDWSSLPDMASTMYSDPFSPGPRWSLRSIRETADQLKSSTCKVCRILSIMAPVSLGANDCYGLVPVPMSISRLIGGHETFWDGTVLNVVDLEPIFHDLNSINVSGRCLAVMRTIGDIHWSTARRIVPGSIDFGELHTLINHCHKNHKVSCKDSSFDHIDGLQVIDITTRAVIRAPYRCTYLALSYVWGKDHGGYADNLEAPAPVIEDAIKFASSMGHRYLWVDRYVSSCPWDSFHPTKDQRTKVDKHQKP